MERISEREFSERTEIVCTSSSGLWYGKGMYMGIWEAVKKYVDGKGWVYNLPSLIYRTEDSREVTFPMLAVDYGARKGTVVRSLDELMGLIGRWTDGDVSMLAYPISIEKGSYPMTVMYRKMKEEIFSMVESDKRIFDVYLDEDKMSYKIYRLELDGTDSAVLK